MYRTNGVVAFHIVMDALHPSDDACVDGRLLCSTVPSVLCLETIVS